MSDRISQAQLIEEIFKKRQTRRMETWGYVDKSLSVDVSDFDIEPNEVSFKREDFPYFRVALLDKYLEEKNDAEKLPRRIANRI